MNNQVINLGNPHEISIRELAEHVMMAMNLQPEIISSERRPFDTVRRCPDISKLLSIVGDFDFTPLNIALEKLLKIDHRTRHEN
jgi:nucleoside-diphosphate-sugar epimerase